MGTGQSSVETATATTPSTEVVEQVEKEATIADPAISATTKDGKVATAVVQPVTEPTVEVLVTPAVVVQSTNAAGTPEPQYISFFNQYIGFIKDSKPKNAIKAFNNCIKTMINLGTPEAFDAILTLFNNHKEFLKPTVVLQEVAILSNSDRASLEVVSTIFHVMLNTPKHTQKDKVNLETARAAVKHDGFVNWCAKKFTV